MTTKIGTLIVDIEGKQLTSEDKDILRHPMIGGIIFFSKNFESRSQLKDLCLEIRKIKTTPLLIMVDQEGGRVQRFIRDFTRLPRMAVFGKIYEQDPLTAVTMARECGWLMATELLAVGIDLSLAPVLDLNNGISSVIGERAFHPDPHVVTTLATAFIEGMHEAGMVATGKHFPGHGSQQVDSHVGIATDARNFAEIEQDDLIPFTGMIASGIEAIMAAHIIFPAVDDLAVSFSHQWLQVILREQLGFKGVIFSDDLNMEGANISTNYADRVIAARKAGCDFTLLCNNRRGVMQVLDKVVCKDHLVGKEKWGSLQADFSKNNLASEQTPRWQKAHLGLKNYLNINGNGHAN